MLIADSCFMKVFLIAPLAVCESGVPDDLGDRHVPHCVSASLSSRAAAAVSLLCLLLSRPPSCHRGAKSLWSLPQLFIMFVVCPQ